MSTDLLSALAIVSHGVELFSGGADERVEIYTGWCRSNSWHPAVPLRLAPFYSHVKLCFDAAFSAFNEVHRTETIPIAGRPQCTVVDTATLPIALRSVGVPRIHIPRYPPEIVPGRAAAEYLADTVKLAEWLLACETEVLRSFCAKIVALYGADVRMLGDAMPHAGRVHDRLTQISSLAATFGRLLDFHNPELGDPLVLERFSSLHLALDEARRFLQMIPNEHLPFDETIHGQLVAYAKFWPYVYDWSLRVTAVSLKIPAMLGNPPEAPQ